VRYEGREKLHGVSSSKWGLTLRTILNSNRSYNGQFHMKTQDVRERTSASKMDVGVDVRTAFHESSMEVPLSFLLRHGVAMQARVFHEVFIPGAWKRGIYHSRIIFGEKTLHTACVYSSSY